MSHDLDSNPLEFDGIKVRIIPYRPVNRGRSTDPHSERKREMNEYTHLQQIAPYTGPQWFVEPIGRWRPAHEVHDGMALIKSQILDTNIMGWDDAEAIIRVTYTNDVECDYLAANRSNA
jgi:hypothetical protein